MGLKDTLEKAMNDEVDVDFSGASEGFGLITNGEYEFECTSGEPGTSKEGNPKVVLKLKIVEAQEHAGRTFFKHCPSTGAGSGILKEAMEAHGVVLDPKSGKLKPSAFVGRRCLGTVRVQPGDAEGRQEVVFLKPVKKMSATRAAGTTKKATSSRLR